MTIRGVAGAAGWFMVVAASTQQSKDWKMDDLLPAVADLGTGRNWSAGREVFTKGLCGKCHALGSESEGTGLAPDLTAVASQFTRDFILQSILEPSATVNGRFVNTRFTMKDGRVITGAIVDVVDKKILVAPSMLAPQATIAILEADVKTQEPSPVSPMPPGLLNQFTKEQIVELMAFLDAGGDRNAAVYKKK